MTGTRLGWLTVDFEAFTIDTIDAWLSAMDVWSQAAAARAMPFAFFLSLEHIAALRARDRAAYDRFGEALARLAAAGCEPHVHNHCLFDWSSGVRSVDVDPFSNPVEGYPRRASMWYDVVRRNGRDWAQWAAELRAIYAEVLDDAGIEQPERVAFRAGGWDTGTTEDEWAEFVAGLDAAGFDVDSSAMGRPHGRAVAEFSTSAYRLTDDLVELAPCVWMNCGAPGRIRGLPSPPSAALRQWTVCAVPPRDGLLVVVLHFDHLFEGNGARPVAERVERFMKGTDRALSLLRLRACDVAAAAAFAPLAARDRLGYDGSGHGYG